MQYLEATQNTAVLSNAYQNNLCGSVNTVQNGTAQENNFNITLHNFLAKHPSCKLLKSAEVSLSLALKRVWMLRHVLTVHYNRETWQYLQCLHKNQIDLCVHQCNICADWVWYMFWLQGFKVGSLSVWNSAIYMDWLGTTMGCGIVCIGWSQCRRTRLTSLGHFHFLPGNKCTWASLLGQGGRSNWRYSWKGQIVSRCWLSRV